MDNLKDRILHPDKYLPLHEMPPGQTQYDVAVLAKPVEIDFSSLLSSEPVAFDHYRYKRRRWCYTREFKFSTLYPIRNDLGHREFRLPLACDVMRRRAIRLLERLLRELPKNAVISVGNSTTYEQRKPNKKGRPDTIITVGVDVWITDEALALLPDLENR